MAGINLEGRATLVAEKERAQVVSTLKDMLELSRQSAEENAKAREAAGITESLAEPFVRDTGDMVRPEMRPVDMVPSELSDIIADESTAPLSEVDPERRADEEFLRTGDLPAAETGEGLISDPRKLGGAEGYGKLTKNIVEGTDKEELKETQSRLKGLGFYESAVDGLTGPSTKSAIKTFQHKNGLEVTGIADKATRLKLAQPEGLVAQEKPKRTLLSFISKGEGGYGAANNGTSKLAKKFSIIDGYYSDTYNSL